MTGLWNSRMQSCRVVHWCALEFFRAEARQLLHRPTGFPVGCGAVSTAAGCVVVGVVGAGSAEAFKFGSVRLPMALSSASDGAVRCAAAAHSQKSLRPSSWTRCSRGHEEASADAFGGGGLLACVVVAKGMVGSQKRCLKWQPSTEMFRRKSVSSRSPRALTTPRLSPVSKDDSAPLGQHKLY